MTKVFKGQEFTVLLKEVLDSFYILVKPTFAEYRFNINYIVSIILNYLFGYLLLF